MKQPELAESRLGIAAAAVSGDSGLLYRLTARLLDDGMPFDAVLFDLLLHSERDAGLRWQTGDYLVSEEHVATATIETVIALLAGSFDQPSEGPFVVVATSEGDNHSLPARAVAADLLYRGYRTVFLGANVLASDLRDFLAIEPPDAVVLSCAMTSHLLGSRAVIVESHSVGVPVLAGGKGFGPDGVWASRVGADAWVPSGRKVHEVLSSWQPDPSAAEASAQDPDEHLQSVLDQRNSILASAERHFTASSGKPVPPVLRTELALALDTASAAMLVDDRKVLDDFVSWQQQTLAARGFDIWEVLAASLSAALAPVAPNAATWIDPGTNP